MATLFLTYQAHDNCLRDYPPSEEDAEQIWLTAERIASTERPIILHSENQEEEILGKLMEAVSEFKDRMSSGAKWAKEKIEERQIQKDEQRISKMGELAFTYTDSFDHVMSEIKTTHTYAEQEQIYDGFMKLLEKQREFVSARKDLASKLKSLVTDSMSSNNVANNTETLKKGEAKKQNLEEGRVVSKNSTPQTGGFVLPSNEAPRMSSMLRTTTNDDTKGKLKQENPYIVIEPPAIRYCKVSIKPLQKKAKKMEEKKR